MGGKHLGYYNYIEENSPLSEAEEKELILKARKKDLGARNRLIYSNLQSLIDYARRIPGKRFGPRKLLAYEIIGMMIAVEKYDTAAEQIPLMEYSKFWMEKLTNDAITKSPGMIHLLLDDSTPIPKVSRRSMNTLIPSPGDDEGQPLVDIIGLQAFAPAHYEEKLDFDKLLGDRFFDFTHKEIKNEIDAKNFSDKHEKIDQGLQKSLANVKRHHKQLGRLAAPDLPRYFSDLD